MDLFGVDWSDGWAGNLTAELVGVVLGLIVTYLVVDRVIRWRLKQERRPLEDRLKRNLESNIWMISVSWALSLSLWNRGELATMSDELQTRVEERLEHYKSPDEVQDLAAETDRVPGRSLVGLAKELLEQIGDISRAADRYANILADDPTLHGLIGDLESCGSGLEQAIVGLPSLEQSGAEDAGRLALVALSKVAFRHAMKLQSHLKGST